MLLAHFGKPADYVELEAELLHDELTTLTELKTALNRHDLLVAIGKTDGFGLQKLRKPLIAHLDLVTVRGQSGGHFVVVTDASGDEVTYVDGTTAEPESVPWDDFQQKWSGHVLFVPSAAGGRAAWFGGLIAVGIACSYLMTTLARKLQKQPKMATFGRIRR